MPRLGELFLPVVPDLTGFGAKATAGVNAAAAPIGRSADKIAGTVKGKIGGAFGSLKGYLPLAAFAGLAATVNAAVDAFLEARKIGGQTKAVIESTGGAAGVTADHVEDLAKALRDVSGLDDEMLQMGLNVLLSFTNIKNGVGEGADIFDQAAEAMADFAARTGKDAAAAAQILGRALDNPINASRSLRAANITLTESQKDQIAALVEQGRTMEAQQIILDEFTERYGGAAEQLGKDNPFAILKSQAGDLLEQFGELIVIVGEALIPIGKVIIDIVSPALEILGFVLKPVLDALAWLVDFLEPVLLPALIAVGTYLIITLGPAFVGTAVAIAGQLYLALAGFAVQIWTTVIPALAAWGAALLPILAVLGAIATAILLVMALEMEMASRHNVGVDDTYVKEVDRILADYQAGRITKEERDRQIDEAQAKRDADYEDVPGVHDPSERGDPAPAPAAPGITMPEFAGGGTVTRTGMAIVHKGEVVGIAGKGTVGGSGGMRIKGTLGFDRSGNAYIDGRIVANKREDDRFKGQVDRMKAPAA